MSTYLVRLPVVMMVCKEIEADSEQDAIGKAINDDTLIIDLAKSSNDSGWMIEEWEALERIVEGNVVHTYNHTAEAEKL